MKSDAQMILKRAASYQSPLPLWLLIFGELVAWLISAYGSGYFFYWIYTIDAPARNDFDVLNPVWYFGMLIGALVSLDIYLNNYKFGQSKAEMALFGDAKKPENIADYLDKFLHYIKPLRIAARYTTVIGFSCLMFGKIDFFMQQNNVAGVQIEQTKTYLQKIESEIDKMPAFEETQIYKDLRTGLNDGILKNDYIYLAKIDSARASYNKFKMMQMQKIDNLHAEIATLQNKSVRVNNVALFDFLGKAWKMSNIALILISVAIAGYVVDKTFSGIAQEIGESITYKATANAFITPIFAHFPVVNDAVNDAVNDVSLVNGAGYGGKSGKIGNSFNIDFNNEKNRMILQAIKMQYGRIKPDGKRVTFGDIANDPLLSVTRQYVHRVKDAAIEEGLLPADFMQKIAEI